MESKKTKQNKSSKPIRIVHVLVKEGHLLVLSTVVGGRPGFVYCFLLCRSFAPFYLLLSHLALIDFFYSYILISIVM